MLVVVFLLVVSVKGVKWGCFDMQCEREIEGRTPFRRGYYPAIQHLEAPYVTAFRDKHSSEIFCMGVLLSRNYALTTSTCVHTSDGPYREREEASFEVLYGRTFKSQKQDVDKIILHPDCSKRSKTETFWGTCDFAIVKVVNPFQHVQTAIFPSLDPQSAGSIIKRSMGYNRYCVGFGLGKYEIWKGSEQIFDGTKDEWESYKLGTVKDRLHKFDVRLMLPTTCEEYAIECCLRGWTWLATKLFRSYFQSINCAARGKKKSTCFGESGGPITCDGYVFGLLKGTLFCPKEHKRSNLLSSMVYISIHHGMNFFRKYHVPTFDANTRPVPDISPFEVDVDSEGMIVDPGSRPELPKNVSEMYKDLLTPRVLGNGTEEDYEDYYSGVESTVKHTEFTTLILALFHVVNFRIN